MSDGFDFFDESDFSNQPGDESRRPDDPRSSRRHAPHNGASHADRGPAVASGLFGLLALAVGVALLVRAVMPGALTMVPRNALLVIAGVAALVAMICTVAARRRARQAYDAGHPGTFGILMVICAVLCIALGLLLGRVAPEGVVKPAVRDEAPIGNAKQMKEGIEKAAGQCTGGWRDIDASSYPGITDVSLCSDNRSAFVTFDTDASASMDRGLVKSTITEQLQKYAGDSRAQGDWNILNGGRWMAVGQQQSMLSLQRAWGGTIEPLQ